MFRQIFSNIPDVTKNLLILNALFFFATLAFANQNIDMWNMLGMHYPSSEKFEPYQIVTHFFMHADIGHIFFNMLGLIILGSQLERMWGKKRFFIFYFVTALGAALLHTGVQAFELYNMTGTFFPTAVIDGKYIIIDNVPDGLSLTNYEYNKIYGIVNTNTVGASGAIYGLLMAYALLFPNTEFMLIFPPIPVKAKWLAIFLGGVALYGGYQRSDGDSVAHFAHLGGMLFGFIMIKIWQRNKSNFY